MLTNYQTISAKSEGFFKDRNSKFYAYASPVANRKDIQSELAKLREQYPDATHHCYAWSLGLDQKEERANDDGEPSGSAGKPILRQIHSANLCNVLIVVVRYYGGKKLGVPGLINAYGEAASLALKEARIIKKEISVSYRVSCPYGLENEIYRIAKQLKAEVKVLNSMSHFSCQIELALAQEEAFLQRLTELHKFEVELLEE